MTDTNKAADFTFTTDMFNWCNAHSRFLDNWYGTVDKTIDSFSNLINLSNDAINQMARQQNKTLDFYLHSLVKNNKKKTADRTQKQRNYDSMTGVAVITGGTGGIGTEICKRLADDGNQVIATYISAEKEKAIEWKSIHAKDGLDLDLYECDVTDFDSCKKMAKDIEKQYGRVDVLVNCAGITRDSFLKKMDVEKWHAVLNTNLDCVFNVSRNFIDGMSKRRYGRIINISSVNGQKGQFGQTNYSAAKAGMIGFTRSLALELADNGITVNCVCPGYVATAMVEEIRDDIKQEIIKQIPIGRLAKPVEIANAVAFLAAKESAYITGTELAVNGGLWLG